MKKVLVTGGLGFIGSNWVHSFHKQYNIRIVDDLKTGSNITNIPPDIPVAKFNINNVDLAYLKDFNPDFVLNFAAESHVDRSIDNPISFFETNVLGTASLLNTIRIHFPNTRFVHVSTDEVYGHLSKGDPKFNENSKYAPRSPYSASKASSDHVVRSFFETYNMDVIITNCCNNYGPRQYKEKLVPTIIENALTGKDIPIYGDGSNIREWVYVDDHNDALTLLMENADKGETFCIGGFQEITNLELTNMICEKLDKIKPLNNKSYKNQIKFVEDRKGHDFRYAIDYSKINKQFNWSPKRPFDSGLNLTIKWYTQSLPYSL